MLKMDLENAKKRLLFSDSSVQSRCIMHLVEIIKKKKKPKDLPISIDSIQVPELSLLWDICCSESLTATAFATDALISLVFSDFVEYEYAVKKFVSISSISNNFVFSIPALSNLLLRKLTLENSSTSCVYSLKYPKHPLILILENKPDTWSTVLDCIFASVEQSENGDSFKFMEPVISYMMFKPNLGTELTMMRNLFLSKLLSLGHKHRAEILNYFIEILPYLQICEQSEIEFAFNIISSIQQLLSTSEAVEKTSLNVELIFLSALTIVDCYIEAGLNPTSPTNIALDICSHLQTNMKNSLVMNASCVILASMMKKSCLSLLKSLLHLCSELVEKYPLSPIVAAMLAVPVIQVLSNPKVLSIATSDIQFVSALLLQLESLIVSPNEYALKTNTSELRYFEAFHQTTSQALLCAYYIDILEGPTPDCVMQWLRDSKHMVLNCSEFTNLHYLLVTAIFLTNNHTSHLQHCLELIEVMCEKKPYLSTDVLCILLYKQSLCLDPEGLHLIMEYLPKTSFHKYAAGPVLNILQMMSSRQDLKPQVIYLMLLLWKRQERCFPQLEKLLTEDNDSVSIDTGINEVRISQAFVIKELCCAKPEQYGVQFLSALSTMINKSSADSGTPSILLSLDAISHLCKSEALDIRSTWKTLAPKLTKDKRSSVAIRVCRFLTLIPQLKVNSLQYEKFMNECAIYLWKLVSSPSSTPPVIGETLRALSTYSISSYNLKNLPTSAKVNLKLPASMMTTPYDAARNPEDVLTHIPGYCFIDFLMSIPSSVILEGYQHLLGSIVKQELDELPRSVYVQRKTIGKKHSATDILSNIPGILCQQYEIRKSSSDRKNIAVGILLSYEPPVTFDRDGVPLKHSVAMHCRLYEQILGILLNDVDLTCNEWQRCLLLPRGWGVFMERTFFACEESRRCELELQRSQKKLNCSDEEFSKLTDSSWLWVRERLLNIMKQNCGNSFAATANSIFAMAGLVGALEKFYAGLEEKTKSQSFEQFVSHDTFQLQCTETLLSALDSNYRPSSQIFGWLLSPLSKQSTSGRSLIKGCSGASLHNLQSVILRCFKDKLNYLTKLLLKNTCDESPALSLYSGIGLGFFLQRLCQENYTGLLDKKDETVLNFAKNIEQACSDDDLKCGNLVCLTIVVSAMAAKGNSTFEVWIQELCDKMIHQLHNKNANSMTYDFFSICTCSMLISACASNVIPLQKARDLSTWLQQKVIDLPQCTSTSICLGVVLDSLIQLNDTSMEGTLDKVKRSWQSTLLSEKEPTLKRLAALNGLCAIYSSGRGLIKLSSNVNSASRIFGLKDFIQLMIDMMNRSKESSIQNLCSWELGRLYSVNYKNQSDTDIVPSSYSYLSERSTLKPLVKFITDNVEKGDTNQLQVALHALSSKFNRPLPPLNWATILTPVLQKKNDKLTETSLKIALHQMATSTSALSIVACNCTAPLLRTLPENCIVLLLENISLLSSTLQPATFKAFVRDAILPTVQNQMDFESKGVIALQAIIESYKSSPNKDVLDALNDAFAVFIQSFANNMDLFRAHLHLICAVFSHVSVESENSIFRQLEKDKNLCHIFLILCQMIQDGDRPLRNIKPYLKLAQQANQREKQIIILGLVNCFGRGCFNLKSELNKAEKCVSFMMENIGWFKVAADSSDSNSKEAIAFLTDVCLAVLVGSSGYAVSFAMWARKDSVDHKSLLEVLPAATFAVVRNSSWDSNIEKMIEWLLQLKMSNELSTTEKYHIQCALCAARTSKSFKKLSVWIDVIPRPVINI